MRRSCPWNTKHHHERIDRSHRYSSNEGMVHRRGKHEYVYSRWDVSLSYLLTDSRIGIYSNPGDDNNRNMERNRYSSSRLRNRKKHKYDSLWTDRSRYNSHMSSSNPRSRSNDRNTRRWWCICSSCMDNSIRNVSSTSSGYSNTHYPSIKWRTNRDMSGKRQYSIHSSTSRLKRKYFIQ